MKLPVLQGTIRRRILANDRVDPAVMGRVLPARFTPKLHAGWAIAGVCLIRLEHVRPLHLPEAVGMSSENAAHRIAVRWEESGETREGVSIARRDTGSVLNHLAGGRIFPGEHHLSTFEVKSADDGISFAMRSSDGAADIALEARATGTWPAGSCFATLDEASRFFETGSVGSSVTRDPHRLDGLKLATEGWAVRPLEVASIRSRWFDDPQRFPAGSIHFDCALLMEDVHHTWHSEPDLLV